MTFYKYAGFWRRLMAFSIDGAIVLFVFVIFFTIGSMAFFSGVMSVSSKEFFMDFSDTSAIPPFMIYLWLFYIFLNIIYFTYFHGLTGRTPGKMIMNLQVISLEGKPISFGTAFLRTVGYFISNILYLGFIWVAFDKRKQGWHDKIAGTVVIIKENVDQTSGISVPGDAENIQNPSTAKPSEINDD